MHNKVRIEECRVAIHKNRGGTHDEIASAARLPKIEFSGTRSEFDSYLRFYEGFSGCYASAIFQTPPIYLKPHFPVFEATTLRCRVFIAFIHSP